MKNKRKEVGMPTGRWGDPSWSNGNVLLTAMTKINRPGVAYGGPGHGVDGVYLEPGCAIAVNAMLDAYAQQHGGAILPLNEGYRSYEGQEKYWNDYGQNPARAARPGTSNHGWGEAVDIGVSLGSSQRAWLLANGPTYGFYALSETDPVHFDYSGTYSPPTPSAELEEENEMYLVRRIVDGNATLNGMTAAMGPGYFQHLGSGDLEGIARDLKIPDSRVIKGQETNGGNGLPAVEFTRLISLFQIPAQFVKPGGRYLAGGSLNN